MADIKWIKITTDMFDNRKIKHLRKLPDGNNIVLIWVMLLTMAGRSNAGGYIFLTQNVPYTPKMLADELDFEENTVILALSALENFNMIKTADGLSITNWDEYQNVEGMDKIREQTRKRVEKHRDKKKMLMLSESALCNGNETQCNVTSNATVTMCNATEKEIEEEKDIERDIPPLSPKGETGETKVEIPFSGELREAFDDWLAYKVEKRQPYKSRGLKSLITQVTKYAEQFGDEETADAIRNSMASNYQGIVFDRLKKGAVDKKANGIRTAKQNYEGSRDFFDVD